MIDFILEFISTHYWTISYGLTYTLGTICSVTLITRFVRMFPTYIKTGSMGNDHLGMFMSYSGYSDTKGTDYFKVKFRDFFTATHLETIFFDTFTCAVIIAGIHVAWIVLLAVVLIITTIYSIVRFVQYLRDQHIRKEEFHDALRGD